MKIKDYKCKCGHNDFFFAEKGNQKGAYCSYCGKWFKWLDKDEQNLAMKQEPVFDKIRAEIVEETLSHSGTGEETIQAYVDGLKKGLDILDKYKSSC